MRSEIDVIMYIHLLSRGSVCREVNGTIRAGAMMGQCIAGRLKVNFVVKVLRVIVTLCPVRGTAR